MPVLFDFRDPARTTHSLEQLLRQFFLLNLQGWARQRDADRLRHDPLMRVAASSKRGINALKEEPPASQLTISRLVRMLVRECNPVRLRRLVTTFAAKHLLQTGGGIRREFVVIDIDGLPIDAHGRL